MTCLSVRSKINSIKKIALSFRPDNLLVFCLSRPCFDFFCDFARVLPEYLTKITSADIASGGNANKEP
jgi:hypothetical protein